MLYDDEPLSAYETVDEWGQGMTMLPGEGTSYAPPDVAPSGPGPIGPAGAGFTGAMGRVVTDAPAAYVDDPVSDFELHGATGPMPGRPLGGELPLMGPAGPGGMLAPPPGTAPGVQPQAPADQPGGAKDWRVRVHEIAGFVPPPGMTQAEAAEIIRRRTGELPVDLTGPEPPPPGWTSKPVARTGSGMGGGVPGLAIPGLPPELQPELGGRFYPADYEQRVWSYLGVGSGGDLASLTPAQLDTANKALEAYRKWGKTPDGMAVRYARLQDEAAQIRALGEQDRLGRQIALDEESRTRAADWAKREREFAETAARRDAAEKQAHAEYQKRAAAADKAVQEVPLGDNRDVGTRIIHVLAAAIGQLGTGLTGQPNAALEFIHNDIRSRIEAQKDEVARRERAAGKVRNDYDAHLQQFDREDEAAQALEARYWREYQGELGLLAAEAQTDIARQRLQELQDLTANAAEQAELGTKLQMTAALLSRPRGGGGGGKAQDGRPGRSNTRPGTVQMVRDQEFADRWSPEIGAYVKPGVFKEVADQTVAWRRVQKLSDDVRAIIASDKRAGVKWDVTQAKLNALIPAQLQSISVAAGGGVIGENDIMRDAQQNPADYLVSDESAAAQAETWAGTAEREIGSVHRTYGVQYGEEPQYVGDDEKGNPRYNVTIYQTSPEIRQQQRGKAAAGAGVEMPEPEIGTEASMAVQQDVAEWEAQNAPQPQKKRGKKGEE